MKSRGKFAALAGMTALLIFQGVARAGDVAKCEDAVAKGSRNVGNQEQKKNRKCIKDAAGGSENTCVLTESDKAIAKGAKLDDLYATGGTCEGVVAQVNNDPNDIEDGTRVAAVRIITNVWGGNGEVDGVVAGDKCSDKIAKRAGKKFDTELKAFRGCVKDNAPLDQVETDGCVAQGVGDLKAQTVQDKLDADVLAQCDTFPVPGTEDGVCGTQLSAAAFSACVGNIVDCEACLAMNNSNNGTANCDLVDDGVANVSCPPTRPCMDPGIYTLTQVAGGTLTIANLSPFPLPPGGTMVLHVGASLPPGCVHDTVVPFPGGFSAPAFCIPSLNFSVQVSQAACGIGRIVSTGTFDGTDISQTGDTSSPNTCGMPASNCATPPGDSNVQVEVEVGGGLNDGIFCRTPGQYGKADVMVSVPVLTTMWTHTPANPCPDPDGMPGGPGDTTAATSNHILDFTTGYTAVGWTDLDADGCCLAGSGSSGFPEACAFGGGGGSSLQATGTCGDLTGLNIPGADVTLAASGPVGSNAAPLYDFSFAMRVPSEITGPSGAATATCASPPLIDFDPGNPVTRCIP